MLLRKKMECPIDNVFHQSTNKCEIQTTEAFQSYHVFRSSRISKLKDGRPYFTEKKISNISVEYELNTNVGKILCGPLENNIQDIQSIDVFITVDNFKPILQQLLNLYMNNSGSNSTPIMYYKNLFDIYMTRSYNGYKINWFRPTYYTHDLITNYDGFRINLIHLMNILCKKCPTSSAFSHVHNPRNRNIKFCKIQHLIRRPPLHLRCGHYKKKTTTTTKSSLQSNNMVASSSALNTTCPNILKLTSSFDISDKGGGGFGGNLKDIDEFFNTNPENICVHVLEEMLNMFGDSAVSQMLNFKCCMQNEFHYLMDTIFGRFECLHSILCCPSKLINTRYIYSLEQLLLTKSTTMTN